MAIEKGVLSATVASEWRNDGLRLSGQLIGGAIALSGIGAAFYMGAAYVVGWVATAIGVAIATGRIAEALTKRKADDEED